MPMIKVNMSLIAAFVAYCHHGSQGGARPEHLLRTRRGDITGAVGQVGSSWKTGGSSASRLVILQIAFLRGIIRARSLTGIMIIKSACCDSSSPMALWKSQHPANTYQTEFPRK